MIDAQPASERLPRVLLLDAYNLLFRGFCSLPESVTDRHGLPINAVYGMLSSVIKMATSEKADHAVAAFDTPEIPTFRHQAYPAYQAQRGPLGGERADDFSRQVELARHILPQTGVPVVAMPGYEADDVIGTLATRLAALGACAIVVSTDRDLLQLVRTGVEVLTPGATGIRARTSDDVRARMGVAPEGITTLKSLAGDASDNIPGVRGIGMKIAASLVNQFVTLESVYASLGQLPTRTARVLDQGREDAFLFRRIVTVETALDLPPLEQWLPTLPFDTKSRAREIIDRLLP